MSNIDDGSWGHLADTEHFGRKTSSSDVRVISYNETTHPKYVNYTKAGHCMIYSKQNEKMFGLYDTRAAVLMQMRFDGYIGFPGGLIDDGENTVSGVNRELVEEINFDLEKFTIKEEHHVISHVNEKLKLILHFFAIEVPLQDFEEMEKKSLSAHDYGNEVSYFLYKPDSHGVVEIIVQDVLSAILESSHLQVAEEDVHDYSATDVHRRCRQNFWKYDFY
ncbi:U8 snoRNA-decapping enzyme [Gryllus bimaculatus]|nr:U8 snoRNA-decapping enzyme [Gryllus bimaculatus]